MENAIAQIKGFKNKNDLYHFYTILSEFCEEHDLILDTLDTEKTMIKYFNRNFFEKNMEKIVDLLELS